MALAAAAGLGLAVASARLAYTGGTNGLTLSATRGSLMTLLVLIVCLATGRRLRLQPAVWLHCVGLGLLLAMMFYGNIASVQFIPVGLAALLFYTYPPMVAIIDAILRRRAPDPVKLSAMLVSFAGLAVMLGASVAAVEPRGVITVLAAAVACAVHAVWLVRKVAHVDTLVATFHMSAVASLVLLFMLGVSGGFRIPVTGPGWIGFAGVVILQSASVPLYFAAIPRVGAVKSAMLSNIQPVMSIAAAFVLFGELLAPVQITGGCMVLGGIWIMQWHDARLSRPQPKQ